MNIFLIGFMGSGKSYTARNLSSILNIPFIDMDKAIEEKEGKSISEIFAEKGEDYFRMLENDFLRNLPQEGNLIISTGGGTPCYFENMEIMNQKGLTIYLNRTKDKCLEQLLKGIDKRPLLKGKSPVEVSVFYDQKLAERKPWYEKARWMVGNAEAEEIAEWIKLRFFSL
jgi:shikimate kinase